jgi:magnesium transporter
MFKTRHAVPGSPPSGLTLRPGNEPERKPKICVMIYDGQSLEEREIANHAEVAECLNDRSKVNWINIDGIDDLEGLEALAKRFDLHALALEDVLHTGQRAKVEPYTNYLFIIAQMVYQDKKSRICGEQVSFFLGKNCLITVQEEPDYDVFNPVRERIRSGRGLIRSSGADYLAYALLDSIIDHYFPVLDEIGNAIEDLEDRMLQRPEHSMIRRLHDHRRSLTQLRRYVWPLRDVVNGLLHDHSGQIEEPTKIFLRDCYDHTVQLMDFVESYKEITTGLMELYHSTVGMRTNEIMRVLTVITSIFIPLTFIVGVYGMNFEFMPELHQKHGYLWTWIIMIAIAVAQLVFFRRKKWL